MTIESVAEHAGVNVHLDPHECELLVKLVSGASAAGQRDQSGPDTASLSLRLGQQIADALDTAARGGTCSGKLLADRMVSIILADTIEAA